jgi:hypothetical protein
MKINKNLVCIFFIGCSYPVLADNPYLKLINWGVSAVGKVSSHAGIAAGRSEFDAQYPGYSGPVIGAAAGMGAFGVVMAGTILGLAGGSIVHGILSLFQSDLNLSAWFSACEDLINYTGTEKRNTGSMQTMLGKLLHKYNTLAEEYNKDNTREKKAPFVQMVSYHPTTGTEILYKN